MARNTATNFRPTSYKDFQCALASGTPLITACLRCKQPFSPENTVSAAGWKDTQIVGWCENCVDEVHVAQESRMV